MPKDSDDNEEESRGGGSRTPNELAAEYKEIILDDMNIADKVININDIKDVLASGMNPYQNVFL